MADRIQQLQALLQSEPDDPFCMYGLALEYAKLGQHEQAVAWFDQTLAANPNYCYAYFHKAKSQADSGEPAAAVETLRTGLTRAKAIGDGKAASEIASLLDELT